MENKDIELIRNGYGSLEAVATILEDEITIAEKEGELGRVVMEIDAAKRIAHEIRNAQFPLLAILTRLSEENAHKKLERSTGLILPPNCTATAKAH